jgi:hypothetical protein
MDAGLVLQFVVRSVAGNFGNEGLVAPDRVFVVVDYIECPSTVRGITLVHASQVRGKDGGLVAAYAASYLQNKFLHGIIVSLKTAGMPAVSVVIFLCL